MSVATHKVTTENAPFADRNKNFLTFLKTFEIASSVQTSENEKKKDLFQKRPDFFSTEESRDSFEPVKFLTRVLISQNRKTRLKKLPANSF